MSVPPASPSARRITTPSWLDLRLVCGVLLVLASVLVGAVVLSRADHARPLVTVSHDMAAGTQLTANDLAMVDVSLSGSGRAAYLGALDDAVGRRLDRAVSRGELLPVAAVSSAAAGTTLTVPFAAGTAPALRSGQRIEVWMSSASCSSTVLLPEVVVQSVHADSTATFGASAAGQDVVVQVSPSLAGRVVAALGIENVHLRAGILSGGSGRVAARSAPLTDIAPCASTSAGR